MRAGTEDHVVVEEWCLRQICQDTDDIIVQIHKTPPHPTLHKALPLLSRPPNDLLLRLPPVQYFMNFLKTNTGPFFRLVSAYENEISRTGGISTLDSSQPAALWDKLGLPPPTKFSADECWKQKPPSMDIYLMDLLHDFRKDTTKIYKRGSRELCNPPPIYRVLEQLHIPDISSTYYAINMSAESARIKIPERFRGQHHIYKQSNIQTTANIAPRFSSADLHIGMTHHRS